MSSPPHTPPRKGGPHMPSGYFILIYIVSLCSCMDLDMDLDFRGASRMTGKKLMLMFTQSNQLIGGIIRGKAMGNVFNAADMLPLKEFGHQLPSAMGKVKIYLSSANPEHLDITKMCPAMTAEATISDTIQPVLEALADSYSPVKGMSFYQNLRHIFIIFRQKTAHLCP